MSLSNQAEKLRGLTDFLFRNLMFEADAQSLRSAGVRVGSDAEPNDGDKETLLDGFPIEMRSDALRMGDLYVTLYCLENSTRRFIEERLQESLGEAWWQGGVSDSIRSKAESRQADAFANPWMDADNEDLMGFVDFGALAKIIVNNWELFSDLIPTQS